MSAPAPGDPDFGLFFVADDGTRIFHTLKQGVPLPHCYQTTPPLWCADEDPTGEPPGMFYITALHHYERRGYMPSVDLRWFNRDYHRRVIKETLAGPRRYEVIRDGLEPTEAGVTHG